MLLARRGNAHGCVSRSRTALLVVIAASAIQGAQTLAHSQVRHRRHRQRLISGHPKRREAARGTSSRSSDLSSGRNLSEMHWRRKAEEERREATEKRKKAAEDAAKKCREEAEPASLDLAGRRATAGNLAVFTLAQIYNDLLGYERWFMVTANSSDAPWFWLVSFTKAAWRISCSDAGTCWQSAAPRERAFPTGERFISAGARLARSTREGRGHSARDGGGDRIAGESVR
jgi:hypothetical protein